MNPPAPTEELEAGPPQGSLQGRPRPWGTQPSPSRILTLRSREVVKCVLFPAVTFAGNLLHGSRWKSSRNNGCSSGTGPTVSVGGSSEGGPGGGCPRLPRSGVRTCAGPAAAPLAVASTSPQPSARQHLGPLRGSGDPSGRGLRAGKVETPGKCQPCVCLTACDHRDLKSVVTCVPTRSESRETRAHPCSRQHHSQGLKVDAAHVRQQENRHANCGPCPQWSIGQP